MLKLTLLVLVSILVVFAGVVALQPAEYQVARSATITAPSNVVFDQINNFHKWKNWSPWAKIDPNMKETFSGPESGTGAVYSWEGNKEVGEGRMTILESRPSEYVRIRLEFIKPFASVANTEFMVKPAGTGAEVTWDMSGHNGFIEKAFCLFQNMDKMIGPDFEKGLAQLKTASENSAK